MGDFSCAVKLQTLLLANNKISAWPDYATPVARYVQDEGEATQALVAQRWLNVDWAAPLPLPGLTTISLSGNPLSKPVRSTGDLDFLFRGSVHPSLPIIDLNTHFATGSVVSGDSSDSAGTPSLQPGCCKRVGVAATEVIYSVMYLPALTSFSCSNCGLTGALTTFLYVTFPGWDGLFADFYYGSLTLEQAQP